MIDIHCHILPACDDGANDLDESIAMAQMLLADGVTHVVATPHCHPMHWRYRDEIAPRVQQLRADFAARGVPLMLLPGSEIQLQTPQRYREDYEAGHFFHLGEGREYSLVEYPWRAEAALPDGPDLICWIVAQGTQPILAHPERTPFLRENPEQLRALVKAGVWLQLTVDSLTGAHGENALHFAQIMAREYSSVTVLATDAHGTSRCSGFQEGFARFTDLCGDAAEREVRARMQSIENAVTRS